MRYGRLLNHQHTTLIGHVWNYFFDFLWISQPKIAAKYDFFRELTTSHRSGDKKNYWIFVYSRLLLAFLLIVEHRSVQILWRRWCKLHDLHGAFGKQRKVFTQNLSDKIVDFGEFFFRASHQIDRSISHALESLFKTTEFHQKRYFSRSYVYPKIPTLVMLINNLFTNFMAQVTMVNRNNQQPVVNALQKKKSSNSQPFSSGWFTVH